MKTLYLLRHAHTVPSAPPLMGDHERFLSPQGTSDATAVGLFMQEHGMYPDFVLSSSAVRTIQTSRLIFGTLFKREGTKIASHFDRRLFHASAEEIIAEIRSMNDSIGKLMLVAHNPGVGDLAYQLGKIEGYSPGTLSVYKVDCESWKDFSPKTAKLELVYEPKVSNKSSVG